jgi:hypothetical protein
LDFGEEFVPFNFNKGDLEKKIRFLVTSINQNNFFIKDIILITNQVNNRFKELRKKFFKKLLNVKKY